MHNMVNKVSFVCSGDSKWFPAPVGLPRIGACLTWFDDKDGSADPWSFLGLVATKLTQAFPKRVTPFALFLDRGRSRFASRYGEKLLATEPLSEALARWKTDPETDFPDRIEFRQHDKTVCIIESEFWSQVGGPMPYHDSVTLAFYSSQLSTDLLLATARAVAHECGASFEMQDAS
jgi:hypothetical protein